jgi:hypothetical protein
MDKKIAGIFLGLLILSFSSVIGIETKDTPDVDDFLLKSENESIHPYYPSTDLTNFIRTPSVTPYAEDIIVYSAHQDWPSRIYLLHSNGSVITYFEYDFTRFVDLEVVNQEIYVAEAFAPRVYKINLDNGDLELIIDDWSLYYFYDIAFDGTYFYVTEWDLNRYDINGNKMGTASFDEYVLGSAWDGTYYWTLNDENQIKCWDISGWPSIIQVPENGFSPPTSHCRGLWFDGQYFWTAECIDATLGKIYKFNYQGEIIEQWSEPAYRGWAACSITDNHPPNIPDIPSGPTEGEAETEYIFSANTTDPEGDSIYYLFDWGDETSGDWLGPYNTGDTCSASHAWMSTGIYSVKVKAQDTFDHQSDWSGSLSVAIYACGDCNDDGEITVSDAVYLINYLFKDGTPPEPIQSGDVNCDDDVNVTDVVYLINYLFKNGPPPC